MGLTPMVGVFIYGIMLTLTTRSPQETESIADWISKWLPPTAIALVGTLGMGKTCFAKGFLESLGVDKSLVSSPTFALLHEYETTPPVLHLDLYRLEASDLPNLGLEERIDDHIDVDRGFVLVEWANLHPNLMPVEAIWVTFFEKDGHRTIEIKGPTSVMQLLEANRGQLS